MEEKHVLQLTAAQLDEALSNALRISNPNLFGNWYFVNPVNQRGETKYSVVAGSTDLYSIDRWRIRNGAGDLIVEEDGIRLRCTSSTYDLYVEQYFEKLSAADAVCFSLLASEASGKVYFQTGHVVSNSYGPVGQVSEGITQVVDTSKRDIARVIIQLKPGASVKLRAAKLEYGTMQTLCHKDDSGNLVLNEIPNYAEELAKCQRYYQLFSSADKRPSDKRDFRPELRTNATSANTGTIVIDGVTYYYADANL